MQTATGGTPVDCAGAITFQIGQPAITRVQSGCLSLRTDPSRDAAFTHCVSNGHVYTLVNGPLAVDGEDWFEVTSPSTGAGWCLAQFLLPAP